jgi:hypothetical protein
MYYTDHEFTNYSTTYHGMAMKYVPSFFPVTVDTVKVTVFFDDNEAEARVWVAEIDPITGFPGDTVRFWTVTGFLGDSTLALHEISGPIATVESEGFFVVCRCSPTDDARLYYDSSPPIASLNHCVEVVGYEKRSGVWYDTAEYDWALWAHVSPGPFLCGDGNGDEAVTTGDGYYILNYFGSGSPPADTRAADANGDCILTTGDGYHVLNHFGSTADLQCDLCWPGCTNCE